MFVSFIHDAPNAAEVQHHVTTNNNAIKKARGAPRRRTENESKQRLVLVQYKPHYTNHFIFRSNEKTIYEHKAPWRIISWIEKKKNWRRTDMVCDGPAECVTRRIVAAAARLCTWKICLEMRIRVYIASLSTGCAPCRLEIWKTKTKWHFTIMTFIYPYPFYLYRRTGNFITGAHILIPRWTRIELMCQCHSEDYSRCRRKCISRTLLPLFHFVAVITVIICGKHESLKINY